MPERLVVDSQLTQVTVFKDRAQLFHTAKISLAPNGTDEQSNEVILVFENGEWSEADRDTLQVNIAKGAQDVTLRSVQFRTVNSILDVRPQKQALRQQIEDVTKQIASATDKQTLATQRLSSLKAVLAKIDDMQPSGDDKELDKQLAKFFLDLAAQRKFHSVFDERIKQQQLEVRIVEDELSSLQSMLRSLSSKLRECGGDVKQTSKDVAEVQLVVLRKCEIQLMLSYLVNGASWTPVYDLRVDSKKKAVGVSYNAMVRQSTAATWDKVALELSTANPNIGGEPPVLSRWNVSLTPPMSVRHAFGFSGGGGPPCPAPQAPMMMQQMMVAPGMTNMMPAGAALPPPPPPSRPAAVQAATVATSSTATKFFIHGRQTIRCDNTPIKVTVTQTELPVHLRYSAVPKLDSHTYLKAKATNTTDFIFLPGTVNTFSDNQFVGKSQMDLVAPNEEFWTFLGVDDDMVCTRKLAYRKLVDKSGMFSGKRKRVEYKYVFTIKSGKSREEEVVVWDQFPISSDKKITVTVTTPSKDTPGAPRFETNDLNAIEWFWNVAPNQVHTFDFIFHVEYPAEERVTGLDAT